MINRLEKFSPEILAGTRILVGSLFASDGAQKLLSLLGPSPEATSVAIVSIAGAIELFGGTLTAACARVPRRCR
jgi:hypothetical protein